MILAFFKVVASKTNLSTFPINGTAKVHNLSDKTIFTDNFPFFPTCVHRKDTKSRQFMSFFE